MDNTIGFPNTYPINYPVEHCRRFEQLAQRFYFWREIGGCGSVRPTKPTHEEFLAPGVYVSGNVSKSFIYCNIVKPVYNSHSLLRKVTENLGKLSGDRNIQGDRFRVVIYRLDCIKTGWHNQPKTLQNDTGTHNAAKVSLF